MTVESDNDSDLERQIAAWRAYMQRRPELHDDDAAELEDHLRERIGDLIEAGLHADEAFLIAVKRMGSLDELSREFAREHSERLWKQLVLPGDAGTPAAARTRREVPMMVLFAVLAAIGIKIPDAFDAAENFYVTNLSLFALVPLAGYFIWRRRAGLRLAGIVAALFAVGAVGANAFRLADDSFSITLTAIHLPIALWLVVGLAYTGGDWRSSRLRMDFIRFTGEWAIYFVLICLGGGVLIAFTAGTFNAIGLHPSHFIEHWMVPCGGIAAVVVAAWLVEAKQSVIENMAPVLTRVFTPLFAVTLLAFLVAAIWTNNGIDVDRDALILFNLLLVVVLGLLLYAISSRDLTAKPGVFDRLQLGLVVCALLIDMLVLAAITGRITGFGFTPNKSAALGENLILLTNLAWSAWLFVGFLRGRMPFGRLESWQTRYLAVYFAWSWVVVLIFPPLFDFA
ncbi:permease prefix domain 1-containing protein [Actinoplanes rectilineatus]|uniref:permease prefix domain 1-containing protein n=1 Tax=Actinoplanes rectilineatus TaxID=113571 RepID=UPI000A6AED93|nr:permease prefix domain 1-containing protein [Actinoplanes rectilineatus]